MQKVYYRTELVLNGESVEAMTSEWIIGQSDLDSKISKDKEYVREVIEEQYEGEAKGLVIDGSLEDWEHKSDDVNVDMSNYKNGNYVIDVRTDDGMERWKTVIEYQYHDPKEVKNHLEDLLKKVDTPESDQKDDQEFNKEWGGA